MKGFPHRAVVSTKLVTSPERSEEPLDVEMRLLVEEIYGPEIRELLGLDIGRAYWGARNAFPYGGDMVDVFQYGNGCTSLAVIDISGHGIRAAKNAGLTKHALRAYVSQGLDPLQSIRALNRLCIENCAFEAEPEFFATAFFAIVNADQTSMQYVSAGHGAACLVSIEGRRFLDATGPILGLLDDDLAFRQETLGVRPGDVFAVVTDGFTEARNEKSVFLGADALAATTEDNRDRSAEKQAQALTVRAFEHAGLRLHDDVAALVVKFTGDSSA